MEEVNIGYGTIFQKTKESFDQGCNVVIHKGGTGSGKTEDLMIYLLFQIALQKENQIITIVSESRPHLDIGAIRILQKHLKAANCWDDRDFNTTSGRYHNHYTNSIIEFFSADRIGKALGARRDWLYGNEINSLKEDVWEELARRSQYIVADFNPTSQFWLEHWVESYENVNIIKSNYLDNPFLPEHERRRIAKKASIDDNFRRIHIDCEYGGYEGLVFTDWQQVDNFPEGEYWCGMDFGYTNDPSALVRMKLIDNDLYVDELLYRTGLTNPNLARIILNETDKYTEIFADSAEPKSIDEIFAYGVNIHPVVKGKDSITNGIDVLKRYNLKITKRSTNLIKELRNYSWMKDKNGNTLNKPADLWNHACDAMRYAAISKLSQQIDDLWVV
jgi:phage terminase large subunit